MSRSFGAYGMKPLDTFNSTFGTTYSSVSININNPSEANSNFVCISGTLSSTASNNTFRARLRSASNAYATSKSYVHCPYNSTVTNATNSVYFNLSRFYTGNNQASTAVSGERCNVIIWIVNNESTVAPIVNTMVYSWVSPEYPNYFHTLPCWNVSQITTSSTSDRFEFIFSSGSVMGARFKSWGWGGN